MEEKKAESTNKNAKKVNLLDHNSIKHMLDESVSDVSHILTLRVLHILRSVKYDHPFVLCVDRYEPWVQGGREAEQHEADLRDGYHRGCSRCSVLQQEVPREQGLSYWMHCTISFFEYQIVALDSLNAFCLITILFCGLSN